MLQLIYVDSRHFTKTKLSLGWSDLYEIKRVSSANERLLTLEIDFDDRHLVNGNCLTSFACTHLLTAPKATFENYPGNTITIKNRFITFQTG